ncbi:MAG: domain S-box protein [Acidobacteriaceae bacterium]|nr:domain S-box protein [Acidobacteriaceae bacterium]
MSYLESAKWQRYLLALALCVSALPIARALGAPSSCLLIAVMAVSLYAGRGPALLATLINACAFEILFLSPTLNLRASVPRLAVLLGAMLLTVEIVEARKRSERARRQLDEDFRLLAETSPDSILSVNEQQLIEFANPAFTTMFGFSFSEVQNKPMSLVLPDLAPGQIPAGEFSAVRSSGDAFDVEATFGRFRTKTTIFLRDISDRKRIQKKLEQSEQSLRLTLDTIPGLVYTHTPDGPIEYANQRLTTFLGSSMNQKSADALVACMHPEDKETALQQLTRNLAKGAPYTMEYRIRRDDGVYRWVQASVQPLKDLHSGVISWYGLLTDIDDLRMTEESLRRTQAQLAQSAQKAAVSELAASIAHEISQPISAMVANGQAGLRWLRATPIDAAGAQAALERIVRDGKDAGEVISGLRSLFRRSSPEKNPVSMRQIVGEVASLVRERAEREGVNFEIAIAEDLPPVLGDRLQLQQILLNLVTNAIDSMERTVGGPRRLTIRAYRDGTCVLTQVADTGMGVADFEAVFDSFFTTKDTGMGMGLSISRSIVEAHSGRLWGEANAGGGTVFSFTVPHTGEGNQRET